MWIIGKKTSQNFNPQIFSFSKVLLRMMNCGGDLVEVGIIKRYKKQRVLLCNKIFFIKPDDIHGVRGGGRNR